MPFDLHTVAAVSAADDVEVSLRRTTPELFAVITERRDKIGSRLMGRGVDYVYSEMICRPCLTGTEAGAAE